MKHKITPEILRHMYQLSVLGASDGEIAQRTGFGTGSVANALARVAPDGRVMDSIYGDKRNDPRYVRRGVSIGLVDPVQVCGVTNVRRHA